MSAVRIAMAVAGIAALTLGPSVKSHAQRPVRAGAVRVVLPPGEVARARGARTVRTEAKKGMALYYSDVLETGRGGRMRARLNDGSILALGSQSRLEVIEHNEQTQQSTFQLQYGKVRAQVVRMTRPGSRFEIRTNTAVAGVLGTDEVVDAFSPIATLVLCVDGIVTVSNSDPNVVGSVILNPGEFTIVEQGQEPQPAQEATEEQLGDILDDTGGSEPQAIADIGTGFVTAGEDLVLSAADSFVTGDISGYQWLITRAADSATAFSQTVSDPAVTLDTTPWPPGNYNGQLTITTADNKTGQTAFGFVVLPSEIANTNPAEVIQQLQFAYETLQPNEFMRLFNPETYTGYAALQESVETSFRNMAQARVFVRTASGQTFEQDHVAIYQVDFEIQFSTKAEPDKLFVVREQATLRMESGSGWLISDVPQGNLGSAGLPVVPGVSDPTGGTTVSDNVTVAGSIQIASQDGAGDVVLVPAGGSGEEFILQNNSGGNVTVGFTLPAGISLTAGGMSGSSFNVGSGETLNLVFSAAPGLPPGRFPVTTTVTTANSSVPGPNINVTVFQVSLTFRAAGASPGNPAPVLLGIGGSAMLQVNSTLGGPPPVSLSGTGGGVTTSFSPNPVEFAQGTTTARSTVTFSAPGNGEPGAGQVAVAATVGANIANGTLFINRIAPFTFSLAAAETVQVLPNESTQIAFNVTCNAPFAGPVEVASPAGSSGVSFSPPSQAVGCGQSGSVTATGGPNALPPAAFSFTASAGSFSQTQSLSIRVGFPIEFSMTPSPLEIRPGDRGVASVQIGLLSGTPQDVEVTAVPGSVNSDLISVEGGGTAPGASGSVSFTITVLPTSPPGPTSFTVRGAVGGIVQEIEVAVGILGNFELSVPPSLDALVGAIATTAVDITPFDNFNAPVALTCSSDNPAITATCPATLLVGQQAEVSVLASTGVAGPGTVSVRGVSGTAVQTATFDVQVSSFILSTAALQPIPLSIGTTATIPVTVEAVAGFAGEVQFTAEATGGITVGPALPLPGGNGTRDFTLTIGPEATPGPAVITIVGVSGGFSSTLQISVELAESFLLSSAPATLFLGNVSPLVIQIERLQSFQGSVTVDVGTLPASVTSVEPLSAVAPQGTDSVTFQVKAAATANLSGQEVSIPFTGRVTPGVSAQQAGRAISGSSPKIVAFNATAVLQAPFSITSLGISPSSVLLGQSATAAVQVNIFAGFPDPVQISGVVSSGLSVITAPQQLNASGASSVGFAPETGGTLSPQVLAQAGSFEVLTSFALQVTVPPSEPFTLSAVPSLLFLGNETELVIQVTRNGNFQGDVGVAVNVNALPPSLSIAVETPAVINVPFGSNTADFRFVSNPNPALAGQTVTIPFIAFDNADIANPFTTTFNVTRTFQAPFTVTTPQGTNIGPAGTNQTVDATVQINFAPGFTAPVTVSGFSANPDVTPGTPVPSTPLQSSGTVQVPFTHLGTAGPPSVIVPVDVLSQAGTFQVTTPFNLTATHPQFDLLVTPNTVAQQVNANVPVTIQVEVTPSNFGSPVTVTVPDGAEMQYDPICGPPPGFVTYTGSPGFPGGGVLTFDMTPPFTSPVAFCMSAGQGSRTTINSGPDSIMIGGAAAGQTVSKPHSFLIGIPQLTVTRGIEGTFNIPVFGGSVTANITVDGIDGFNLPVTINITGSGSFIGSTGPFLQPIVPSGVSSPDCGPGAPGRVVSPGGSTTCTIVNNTPDGSSPNPVDLEAFGVFGGGASVAQAFQVCALDSDGVNFTCGGAVPVRSPARFGRASAGMTGAGQAFGDALLQSGLPSLSVAPSGVWFTPLLPKEGDLVRLRAEVENRGGGEARDVAVTLVVNKQTVAVARMDVPAGGSRQVEFEWEAVYDPRLSVAVAVDPEGRIEQAGEPVRFTAVRGLTVEPPLASVARQGRSLVVVRNEDCGGFRFLSGAQSFCGGSSDFELNPVIQGGGQLLVQILSLNGGIVDLGPRPITGVLSAPETGYGSRAVLQRGHLYAVESNRKYALLYVANIQSDIDPRLARLGGGLDLPAGGGLSGLQPDTLSRLLDQSNITVDLQWSYLENGSRHFQYGFAAGRGVPRPDVYRQPRVPSRGAKQ